MTVGMEIIVYGAIIFILFLIILLAMVRVEEPKKQEISNPPAYQMTVDALEKKQKETLDKVLKSIVLSIENGQFSLIIADCKYSNNDKYSDHISSPIDYIGYNKKSLLFVCKELRKRGFKVKHVRYPHYGVALPSNLNPAPQFTGIKTIVSWEK